jgi:DNA-binding GntR family transcriptional regulator
VLGSDNSLDGADGALLGEEVADRIQTAIFEGTLKPDARLGQAKLAESLGVSRTPVREALLILQSRGLVTFVRNRGAVVRRITRRECSETFLVRAELEGLASELAARAITAAELRSLSGALTALDECEVKLRKFHPGDGLTPDGPAQDALTGYFGANERFHDIIVDASHCRRLAETLKYLLTMMPRPVTLLAIRQHPFALENYREDHIELAEALRAHDPRRARRCASGHVSRARDLMLDWIEILDEAFTIE